MALAGGSDYRISFSRVSYVLWGSRLRVPLAKDRRSALEVLRGKIRSSRQKILDRGFGPGSRLGFASWSHVFGEGAVLYSLRDQKIRPCGAKSLKNPY